MKKIIFLITFLFIFLIAEAQPGIGCLRTADGHVYTQKNFLGIYELLGNNYPTTPTACPRVQLGTKTGNKCVFVALGTQHDEYNYVLYTANGPVQCDLDHYAVGAIVIVGFFGFRRLNRKPNA